MTRRHFQRLAQALRNAHTIIQNEGHSLDSIQYDILVNEIARACSDFNPRFQREKFKDAAYSNR